MDTKIDVKQQDVVKDDVDIHEESSKTALVIGIVMAALVGIWGVACLIGGLSSSGMGGAIKGYITAVFG